MTRTMRRDAGARTRPEILRTTALVGVLALLVGALGPRPGWTDDFPPKEVILQTGELGGHGRHIGGQIAQRSAAIQAQNEKASAATPGRPAALPEQGNPGEDRQLPDKSLTLFGRVSPEFSQKAGICVTANYFSVKGYTELRTAPDTPFRIYWHHYRKMIEKAECMKPGQDGRYSLTMNTVLTRGEAYQVQNGDSLALGLIALDHPTGLSYVLFVYPHSVNPYDHSKVRPLIGPYDIAFGNPVDDMRQSRIRNSTGEVIPGEEPPRFQLTGDGNAVEVNVGLAEPTIMP